MNTLKITNILIESGLEHKPAEAIAEVVDKKNQEIATKNDIQSVIKNTNTLIFGLGGVTVAGFGFIYSLLNTIITKLN
jgi:hypothetical protein